MSVSRKRDAGGIAAFIAEQTKQEWLQLSPRHEWPLYLYHYTDIHNAVQILKDGFLFSRTNLQQNHGDFIDTNSGAVLAWTEKQILACARLTFRPLTPMQYHHEGIKTKELLEEKKDFSQTHSPVPIFLLFDAAEILGREDSKFSEFGLGRPGTPLLSSAEDFRSLPWNDIYALGPFGDIDKSKKISRRNAEVIVPDKLDLTHLSRIHCRSVAEKETLVYLLTDSLRSKHLPIITSTARDAMFHRKRTFVQSTELSEKGIKINFSPDTECPGPYMVKLVLRILPRRREFTHVEELPALNRSFRLSFKRDVETYEIELYLDDFLAYSGRFAKRQLIF